MEGVIVTRCPPMDVYPPPGFWLFRDPFGDRTTARLEAPSRIAAGSVQLQATLVYPPCTVSRNNEGRPVRLPDGTEIEPDWIVQAFTAQGRFAGSGKVDFEIAYDEEAIVRRPGGIMEAQPCAGIGWIDLPGGRGVIHSLLPIAAGRPTGRPWQWWKKYVVDAVDVRSVILF